MNTLAHLFYVGHSSPIFKSEKLCFINALLGSHARFELPDRFSPFLLPKLTNLPAAHLDHR